MTLDDYITNHAQPYLQRTAAHLRANLAALAAKQATSKLDEGGKAEQLKAVLDEARQHVGSVRVTIAHEVQEAERLGRPLPADLAKRRKPIDDLAAQILGVSDLAGAEALVASLDRGK